MLSFEKLKKFISSITPGFFIVGYVIGTGSVTSMVVAGARYGMSFTWALLLSCVFTFIMLVSISKITIVTSHTIMFNIKTHIGRWASLFIILGLLVTIISSIMGVMAVVAEVIQEWTRPMTSDGEGLSTLVTSIIFLLFLLFLYWTGKHNIFMRFI